MAAGTTTEHPAGKERLGNLKTYAYRYTLEADAAGEVTGASIPVQPGFLYTVETAPDSETPPTDGYTLRLENSRGVDLLAGGGAARSATNSQILEGRPRPVSGTISPVITGAGDGGKVDLVFWIIGG